MTLYGYARVSTLTQNIEPQIERLVQEGCDLIRQECLSGTSTKERTELRLLLEFIRPGDVLVITRIDRLARSIGDLTRIIEQLDQKGASLRVTEQPLDTATSQGRLMLYLLGTIAEFENDLRRERQMEGIEAAKQAGRYQGRRPDLNRAAQVLSLHQEGLSLQKIALQIGMSRSGVYRIIQADKKVSLTK